MPNEYHNRAGRFELRISDHNSIDIQFHHNDHVVSTIQAFGDKLEDLKDLQYLLSRALEIRS